MFAKSALLCALLAASAQVALAQPSCLLAAVNKFEHPADQETLCCKSASQVKNYVGDLCASGDRSDALSAFKNACQQSGHGSCSSSSSTSSSSSFATGSKTATATATASGSSGHASASGSGAPYPIAYMTTYFDHVCSCTKTAAVSSTGIARSIGFATGTAPIATGTASPSGASAGAGAGSGSGPGLGSGSGAGAAAGIGSPIAPVAPSNTGSAGAAGFTGAATKNIGSVAAGLLAVAGIAIAL